MPDDARASDDALRGGLRILARIIATEVISAPQRQLHPSTVGVSNDVPPNRAESATTVEMSRASGE